MPHADDELLFSEQDLRLFLEDRRRRAVAEIDSYHANQLLNSSVDELTRYFVEKYSVAVPTIREDAITADQNEARVDVTGRFEYGSWDGEQLIIPGTQLTLHVPVDGDLEVLRYQASSMNYSLPRARIIRNEIVLTYTAPQGQSDGAKPYFDRALSDLKQHLGWSAADVQQFNGSLPSTCRQAIDARRGRLLANQNSVASLGYPLRQRADAPRTYAIPDVRRRTVPVPPPASTAPFVPEPALSDEVYEQILGILANMVRVMEQSPEAFSGMAEQDLRTHFLVQLNGQFEGRASGETFHGSGRTDILLVDNDRSVFIAECKFWQGPASVTESLSQLLDYATWRDAKAALLLFNRNVDFSAVVQQVPSAISAHEFTVGAVTPLSGTTFRSRLRQRDDSARLITLTTLVYNVPTTRPTSERLRPRRGRRASES